MTDVGTLSALVEHSRIIICVCPPDAATDLARAVAGQGFSGVYVDANAVSPATVREARQIVEAGGASFVDGGIIGPPALTPGTTRLYLSGGEAGASGGLFPTRPARGIVSSTVRRGRLRRSRWRTRPGPRVPQPLLIAIRTLAINEGVDAALIREWELSQVGLPGRSAGAVRSNARKAWRFSGEMEEIADTFDAAGLPDGFHRAAADIYRRMTDYKDTAAAPSVEEVAARILAEAAVPDGIAAAD